MAMRTLTARYPGTCKGCGGRISRGEVIRWGRAEGTFHTGCVEGAGPAPGPRAPAPAPDVVDDDGSLAERRRDDAEYERGVADADRYLSDRRIYGEELAEQWEIEREMREGWDY